MVYRPVKMSPVERGTPSAEEIQRVQNLVETCLLHYMNKKECMNTLINQDNIDPAFTELVWERLEAENQEFFKAYHLRLLVNEQIKKFNKLLLEQVELMNHLGLIGSYPELPSIGPRISPRALETEGVQQPQVSDNYGISMQSSYQEIFGFLSDAQQNTVPFQLEDMQQPMSSLQWHDQETLDMAGHDANIDVSQILISQNPNMAFAQTMDANVFQTESGYSGNLSSTFNNFVESCPPVDDASLTPFNSVAYDAQYPIDSSLEALLDSFFGTSDPGIDADNVLGPPSG